MAYIRIKKIGTNSYAYAARSISTPNGSRQKVIAYLGRVYTFIIPNPLSIPVITTQNNKTFILELLDPYLQHIGFRKMKEDLVYKNICLSTQDLLLTKGKHAKPVALKINDGYLCSFTLAQLLNFSKTKDVRKDGIVLATFFQRAGIPISQEQFIAYYQIL
jgi:hypothetical protein